MRQLYPKHSLGYNCACFGKSRQGYYEAHLKASQTSIAVSVRPRHIDMINVSAQFSWVL